MRAAAGALSCLSGRLLLLLCLLEFELLLTMGFTDWRPWELQVQATSLHRTARRGKLLAGQQGPFLPGKPGPWGTLEYARITIEPPDDFVPASNLAFPPTRWHFVDWSRQRLTEFLNACELTAGQRTELLNPDSWANETNGIAIMPPASVVLALGEDARARIYSALADSPLNEFQCWPYTFRPGGFDEWFRDSGLSAPTLALVKRLTYTRGASLCFSDLPEVLPHVAAEPERQRLVKTLLRNSTLLMTLRVNSHSDAAALTAYWTRGWDAPEIAPLLQSLTKVPDPQGVTIDVARLLPPFVKKRLNSYPVLNPSDPLPDCFWSAMNFFKDPPDERFHDPAAWLNELTNHCSVVTSPTYGDLVFLLRADETPLHAAVYIADDVVFTKNGANDRQPWILMKWDDMLARYPENKSVRAVIFRPNRESVAMSGTSP